MRWVPLESNPDVLNAWAKSAGLVVSQAQFYDIYGLDTELLAMVPQPVKAVILLFPITPDYETKRLTEDRQIKEEGQHPVDPTIIWIKQTIGNACGTMGLLHAFANSDVTVAPDSPLAKFIDQCKTKTPEERSKLLEETELFANIHADAASAGQTEAPEADSRTDLHFTCFVQAPSPPSREEGIEVDETGMRLLELDGRRDGPVDRGISTNFLEDVSKIVKEVYMNSTTSAEFSMLALSVPPQDED